MEREVFLPREEAGYPVGVRDFLEGFKETEIKPEWSNDTSSVERLESAVNLVRLLEEPIARSGIRELKTVETHTRKFKDAWRGRARSTAVRVAESQLGGHYISLENNLARSYREGRVLPDMAVKTYSESGSARLPSESWLVPLEDKRFLEISLLSNGKPLFLPLRGLDPAPRSDIETSLNMVGSYFKSVYDHCTVLQRDSLQQRLINNEGIVGSLARTAFRLVA